MSCSRTQHGGGRSRTPDLSLRSPTLYHWATALPQVSSTYCQVSWSQISLTIHLSPTNIQNLATIFTAIFLCPPWPQPAGGIERSGCAYIRPSVAEVKIFVQGRISGTIDDRKLKKCLLTYNGENNVSGLFTFEWIALIAEVHIWPWHIGLRWAIVALWTTCIECVREQ